MYRAALRSSPASATRAVRQPVFAGGARRLLTTAAASKKSTWKGSAVRWGAAIGAVYWYNTSPIFADEVAQPLITAPPAVPEEPQFFTVDAVLEQKQKEAAEKAKKAEATKESSGAADVTASDASAEKLGDGSPEGLEEEASQQGAFNPETGEINWDCPCLGGMAHGPCGEEFRSAFSCFVFSEEEPKGMDCIDKFQHMQDCFRLHPEIYGAELQDDEPEGDAPKPAQIEGAAPPPADESEATPADAQAVAAPVAPEEKATAPEPAQAAPVPETAETKASAPASETAKPPKKTKKAKKASPVIEDPVQAEPAAAVIDEAAVPKAAFDATTANK